ncbi:Tetratricopeptide repeat-containing protein [Epilithonimonas hungarica]|uniref:Tetratricopeptide repeat-containing protein n=2 Tax=Epilithonimonas hungarica TaxID=454006 RepID=A0A1G7JYJ4_9FLAO|nr:Tetratricopeptide repeat-containing protein [Epilithonimonas hungarica]
MNKILLYILLCLPVIFFSQNGQKIKEIEVLLDSSYIKTTEFDLPGAIKYAQKALRSSNQKKYSRGIAISNFRIAQCLTELSIYKQGLEYLDKAQHENQILKDPNLNFEIRRVRSRIYGNMKLLPNAISESKKALETIPELKKDETEKKFAQTLINENIALIYRSMEKPDSTFYYLNENQLILETLETQKYLSSIINNYVELGNYYLSTHDPKAARSFLSKAINTAKTHNYPFLSHTFRSYGDLMIYNKENDSAIIYYKKALEISEQTKLKSEIPPIYQKMSNAYHLLGNKVLEEKYKLRSLELQNNLKSEMLSASSLIINSILSDQKDEFTKKDAKANYTIITITVAAIVLFVTLWLLYRRKVKKFKHLKKISSQKEKMLIQQKEEITLRYREDTRNLEQKINQSFDDIFALAKSNNPEFFTRFQEVYPEVISAILSIDSKLRISELTLCAYFFLGFTTKEIALYTFKSINTVRNRRQNLRNKLQIPADEDLELWFKTLSRKN